MRKILAAVLLPKSHVGLDASSIIMAELKDGVWTKADPLK
jgi:hypothetical protein